MTKDSILRKVLKNKVAIDKFVCRHFGKKGYKVCKFSDFFVLLFDGNVREFLFSFLEPVSEAFPELRSVVDDRYYKAASKFVTRTVFWDSPQSRSVEKFLAYLFKVYVDLRGVMTKETRQNIFRFLTIFPLSKIRAILVFHTPSGSDQKCGIALHCADVPATHKVVEHLNLEMNRVQIFIQTQQSLNGAPTQQYTGVDLSGWLDQGVLLMNVHLTYKHGIWNEFSRCLLKVISNSRSHLSFILAGQAAKQLFPSIQNKPLHFIQRLYHPTHGDEHRDPNNLWDIQMPFINSNFFLYQTIKTRLVDWESISERIPIMKKRGAMLRQFFDFIQSEINARKTNATAFIMRRQVAHQTEVLFQVRGVKELNADIRYWQLSHVSQLPVKGSNGLPLDVIDFVAKN